MILQGPKLLLFPDSALEAPPARVGLWLFAAALTASIWPAAAVVLGHMGSSLLSHAGTEVATARAAVGFVCVVGSAVVAAPALALILWRLGEMAHERPDALAAAKAAMGVVWPAWAAGIVLFLPPLFGMSPLTGELLWAGLAFLAALRAIKRRALAFLGIRRRWATGFFIRSLVAFVIVFGSLSVVPAVAARVMLGATAPSSPITVEPPLLPRPPTPEW